MRIVMILFLIIGFPFEGIWKFKDWVTDKRKTKKDEERKK